MRKLAWIAIASVLAFGAGCDDETTTDMDSGSPGVDAGGGGEDAGGGGEDAGGGGEDAGGGDMDAGGGGEDGGTTGTDAGMIGDCTPASVDILETCPDFSACGGAVAGAWCYTGVCIEESELLGSASTFCPTVSIDSVSGTVTGRVEFVEATSMVTRAANTHVEATVDVPAECAFTGCGTIETSLNDALGPDGSASCSPSGSGGCTCMVVLDSSIDSTDEYSLAGNTIRVGTGSSTRTFDYCVEGDGSLRFRETGGDAQEPGVQTISPE